MSLLSVNNLEASYGTSQALFGVNLEVAEGEVVALMGRNGMGKSTTVKAVCRMIAAQGELGFAGQDLSRLPSHRAAQLGIGLVPEGRRCFADLTVYENLIAAARPGAWDFAQVTTLFPRLAERRDQRAKTLSGGEQQMLAIGRALMTNPRLSDFGRGHRRTGSDHPSRDLGGNRPPENGNWAVDPGHRQIPARAGQRQRPGCDPRTRAGRLERSLF